MEPAESMMIRLLLLVCFLMTASPVKAIADTTPPELNAFVSPADVTRELVTVAVYANDPSGVKAVYCRIQGQLTWQIADGSGPCELVVAENMIVEYRAEDLYANATEVRTLGVCQIDHLSPVLNPATVIEQNGVFSNEWTQQDDPNFVWIEAADPLLTCDDGQTRAGSGLNGYYLYFGTDPQGTSDQLSFGNFFDPPAVTELGVYYLRARAQDYAGNQGGWVNLFTFKVDSDQPDIAITSEPAVPDGSNGWYRSSPTISGTASDTTSAITSFESSVNGANWHPVADIQLTSDGQHMVSFKATDQAGNVTTISTPAKIDRLLPDFKLVLPTNVFLLNGWYFGDLTLPSKDDLSPYDLSGITQLDYQVGNAAWTSVPPSIAQSGVYSVNIRMADYAGNSGESQVVIQLDKDGPIVVAAVSQSASERLSGLVNFIGEVIDSESGLSGVFYRVDAEAWHPVSTIGQDGKFSMYWDSRKVSNGSHTITFEARDNTGHTTVKTITVETQNFSIFLPSITR